MTDRWLSNLTEAQFQEMIVTRAKARGWLVHHDRRQDRSIAGDAGFPDLVLARGGVVIFAELKREKGGRLSPEQRRWIEALSPYWDLPEPMPDETQVYLWRPSDWPAIQQLLDQEEQ